MCIYRCEIKKFSRSKSQSAVAAAAYRSGGNLVDDSDWKTKQSKAHDYTRRSGVVSTGILLPTGAPNDLNNRANLWNAAEQAERKGNSLVAREAVLALPHELTDEQRLAATKEFAAHMVDTYGVACDYAIHRPDKHPEADKRNHHAHIMFTTRVVTAEGLGAKTRVLDDKKTGSAEFTNIRKAWEVICNDALAQASIDARVDSRSLEAQGIERLPEPKQGAIATQIEREGRDSHAGEERRAVKAFNETLEHIPDDDEPDAPDEDEEPVRRKREVDEVKGDMIDARKQDKSVAALLYRRGLQLMRRLQQQRRRRQEQLRRRMQLLTRSMLMNTWRKHAAGSNVNQGGNNQAQAPPTKAEYSDAEILAALAAQVFELD